MLATCACIRAMRCKAVKGSSKTEESPSSRMRRAAPPGNQLSIIDPGHSSFNAFHGDFNDWELGNSGAQYGVYDANKWLDITRQPLDDFNRGKWSCTIGDKPCYHLSLAQHHNMKGSLLPSDVLTCFDGFDAEFHALCATRSSLLKLACHPCFLYNYRCRLSRPHTPGRLDRRWQPVLRQLRYGVDKS